MIFGAFVLALILCAHLPSPHNWIFGVVVIATFPCVLRWARSGR